MITGIQFIEIIKENITEDTQGNTLADRVLNILEGLSPHQMENVLEYGEIWLKEEE